MTPNESHGEVTQLLVDWSRGDSGALERLIPLVDSELHKLALQRMNSERPGHSLQASALVNEAYLRLIDGAEVEWQNRAHFFGFAAVMMRRILVDHARRRRRAKRGGGVTHLQIIDDAAADERRDVEIIALDQALNKLASFDERKSRVVELRFFGGLNQEETAEAMKTSVRTVQREWSLARSWLLRELSGRHQVGC
ncbi:MAG TPA: sigma-70 family RNA polymerase sigma factor [Bryobacteraceae bacterium]